MTATAQIIVAEGLENATTNKIADRAGVGIGTLYHFFSNKEALMSALMDQYYKQQWECFEEVVQTIEAYTLDRTIEQIVRAMTRKNIENRKLQKILIEHAMRVGQVHSAYELEQRIAQRVQGILKKHHGLLKPGDLTKASRVVVHTASSMMYLGIVVCPDLFDAEDIVQEILSLVRGYLLK